MSTIAVLLSVYRNDRPEWLRQAITSIWHQTNRDFDIFLYVDGEIPDRLRNEIDALASERPLIVLQSVANKGLAHALNELITNAIQRGHYEYFARMDADDIASPKRFELQLEYFKAHPHVSVLGTWSREVDQFGVPLMIKKLPETHAELVRFMALRSPFVHPSVMFSRRVFEGGYLYNTQLRAAQDYEFWSRLAVAGFQFANLPLTLIDYRMNSAMYSRRSFDRLVIEVRMRVAHMKRFELLTTGNLFKLAGFILLRLAPTSWKHFAYVHFR
jgi:glycosyltransferase involved in cell wall biosynthesis